MSNSISDSGYVYPDGTIQTTAFKAGSVGPTQMSGNQTGSAPVYGCRAWVNFVGATAIITASGNVTSVTRNGAGDYTINFTTAMPSTAYAVVGSAYGSAANNMALSAFTFATGSVRVYTMAYNGIGEATNAHVAIFC